MNIRKLEWDSDFFGMRIGRVDLQTAEEAAALSAMRDELAETYDLLYIFDANHVGFVADGAKLVDEKVLYSKPCEHKTSCMDVLMYAGCKPTDSLYHLAHVSGGFSRFKLDAGFRAGDFERMYDRWIENACPQEGTNKQIFVYCPEGIAKGMITVDYNMGGSAHIGLVAVDTDCQHSGVGTKIMSTVEEYLYRKGTITTLEVPTQKANVDACRWYEKNGFRVESVVDIYHWWL